MPELPIGTVTLLFTDIEGSTQLLRELDDAYAKALAEHRRLLREAFANHRGVEVDTQGDAFFVAFARAADAVAAAEAAQRALAGGRVRVRIGIHTGEPILDEEGYVGLAVHVGARIAGVGHGGQVLISRATRDLLDSSFELLDLGEHRLKNIGEPVRIFQLGGDDFPPIRSLSNTNLPIPVTSFVGRQQELEEAAALLAATRVLTVVGPGGTGKTRFAIELAAGQLEEYPNGIFWVPLAPLREPSLVLQTAARLLGAKEELATHIGHQRLLLLFDNFEHLVEAATGLSQLLSACPNLKLLITSRELLRIQGESDYPLPALVSNEAVELFCARARVEPSAAVEELCRRLEGLPLAIELAAARARLLSPEELLDHLGERLDLLRGGRDADPRHATLRATITWSYELLTEEEQVLFARLAAFAGGCSLEAGKEVCEADLDTLGSLLDKSLVRRADDRFWMLETMRAYALERLDELSDASQLRRRHAEYFLALAEQAEPELEKEASPRWLDRLEVENDNLRAALSWFSDDGDNERELRLATALSRFWYVRGHLSEGKDWLEAAVARGDTASNSARVAALDGIYLLAHLQSDYERARTASEECLALCGELGDSIGVARALRGIASVLKDQDKAEARPLYEESLALCRANGDRQGAAFSLTNLSDLALRTEDYERAEALGNQALGLFQELGNRRAIVGALVILGMSALHQRQYPEAGVHLREGLRMADLLGYKYGIASSLEELGNLSLAEGDFARAARLFGAAEELRKTLGIVLTDEPDKAIHERAVASVRGELREGFQAAWEEGRAMTLEQAIELG
jgi:predicted ATPase